MAQIPNQRQGEVSLEVALPLQARLCNALGTSQAVHVELQGAPKAALSVILMARLSMLATVPQQSLTPKTQKLKPEQVEDETVVLVLPKVAPGRKVPSKWAE